MIKEMGRFLLANSIFYVVITIFTYIIFQMIIEVFNITPPSDYNMLMISNIIYIIFTSAVLGYIKSEAKK